jgi:hypothetical protein
MKASKALRRKATRPAPVEQLGNDFLRGMISTGLLLGVQQGGIRNKAAGIRVAARALQGGAALASAVAAANALQQGRSGRALGAVALGAASLAGIEYLLKCSTGQGNE